MRAVVLVGGFGTRLRPLTNDVPKPMLPVGHRPMIARLVDRLARVGFSWRAAAENVASGQTTAGSVMAAWMNSPGHRSNILSTNTRIGVGFAVAADGRRYWTQVFATPR